MRKPNCTTALFPVTQRAAGWPILRGFCEGWVFPDCQGFLTPSYTLSPQGRMPLGGWPTQTLALSAYIFSTEAAPPFAIFERWEKLGTDGTFPNFPQD